MAMRILVTGGAGYLGSVLVPVLLERGHEVVVLERFLFSQTSLLQHCLNPRFQVIRGDCRDEHTLRQAMHDADVIMPLAAIVGAPACDDEPIAARSVNLDSVRLMLKLRSGSQRIIYPTTNTGYGIGEKGKLCTEETPLRPVSLYGRTKVEAEAAILDAGNAITLRPGTLFGMSPRPRVDLLVNGFVHRAVTDRAVILFEARAQRNYCHIRDGARAFLHALDNFELMKEQPYNVGLSDANLTKLELCERIKRHLPAFVYLESPVGEDPDKRDYIVSNEKIEATGFRPEYSLDDGIRELIKGFSMLRNGRFANVL
jgi:nucleoside-diphosphate-sugar epimerase